MPKVAVVYFTKTDVTGQLAQAVITGLQESGVNNIVDHKIEGKEIIDGRFVNPDLFDTLKSCDAIIMGSPTYMGGVSAQFKSFADASSDYWSDQFWSNKVAAGFTSGSALNGDQASSLQYLVTLANQHGMYWVGLDLPRGGKDLGLNRLGCQLGVVAQSSDGTVNEVDLATARYLGKRVANLVNKLEGDT